MEKYESLGLVGEGSYGMVTKCRHKETGQLVAIKKFLESEDDKMVRKIAMREIKMLKQLRHENLVNLIEVFRRKKRLYLVFEFVDHTILDDLERYPRGLDEHTSKRILFQIIHRDVKPENILVSKSGIVKLCDFGFARALATQGETYTDYVATRWYRSPELLVGDTKYGQAVDIWAVGCLGAEMLTGEPLFPGDSDIDQLHHIINCLGSLSQRYQDIFLRNPLFVGTRIPEPKRFSGTLEMKLPNVSRIFLNFIKKCLILDAEERPNSSECLNHELFTRDNFDNMLIEEIIQKTHKETESNPLLISLKLKTTSQNSSNVVQSINPSGKIFSTFNNANKNKTRNGISIKTFIPPVTHRDRETRDSNDAILTSPRTPTPTNKTETLSQKNIDFNECGYTTPTKQLTELKSTKNQENMEEDIDSKICPPISSSQTVLVTANQNNTLHLGNNNYKKPNNIFIGNSIQRPAFHQTPQYYASGMFGLNRSLTFVGGNSSNLNGLLPTVNTNNITNIYPNGVAQNISNPSHSNVGISRDLLGGNGTKFKKYSNQNTSFINNRNNQSVLDNSGHVSNLAWNSGISYSTLNTSLKSQVYQQLNNSHFSYHKETNGNLPVSTGTSLSSGRNCVLNGNIFKDIFNPSAGSHLGRQTPLVLTNTLNVENNPTNNNTQSSNLIGGISALPELTQSMTHAKNKNQRRKRD